MYRVADGKPSHALIDVDEEVLPQSCAAAFSAFEQELRRISPAAPEHVDLQVAGAAVERFYPNYPAMAQESMGWAVATGCFVWLMGVGAVCVPGALALIVVPERLWSPFLLGVLALGMLGFGSWVLRGLLRTARQNRVKRAVAGRIGYGSYILQDALVMRSAAGCSYIPRDVVREIKVERFAAHTAGGHRGPSRSVGPESSVTVAHADLKGEWVDAPFLPGNVPGHEPEVAARLQAWLGRDPNAVADPNFGKLAAGDLHNQAYAAAWRGFKRRRLVLWLTLVLPITLLIVGFIISSETMEALSWPIAAVILLPPLIAWPWHDRFKCPRCACSPRQPLASTDMSRCLHCGLPIYTELPG